MVDAFPESAGLKVTTRAIPSELKRYNEMKPHLFIGSDGYFKSQNDTIQFFEKIPDIQPSANVVANPIEKRSAELVFCRIGRHHAVRLELTVPDVLRRPTQKSLPICRTKMPCPRAGNWVTNPIPVQQLQFQSITLSPTTYRSA
jgi:hypothetical protein